MKGSASATAPSVVPPGTGASASGSRSQVGATGTGTSASATGSKVALSGPGCTGCGAGQGSSVGGREEVISYSLVHAIPTRPMHVDAHLPAVKDNYRRVPTRELLTQDRTEHRPSIEGSLVCRSGRASHGQACPRTVMAIPVRLLCRRPVLMLS